ncbi:peptidylprolyl isomerase [Thalassovita mediterranea]|jgi:peptidyl-prolyl cis-trans isomerase SurA|uniref:Parvulin-like PPIase n=2 Tax=Thalassovita mediterranea TaxID=340021 RepID=A0A0P1GM24_9RHOB|nr:peptidylprolyl isomerase [Thalassovita mediterranea]CUH83231.1 Peptidyl-prolyl cis-trans isomerase SurA [Thalassovita mediterranea]SIS33568.1 periplasmic chaperone for outer membrane proteins SurA [Thalassovita mediterranea]
MMMKKNSLRQLILATAAAGALLSAPGVSQAQGLFAPVVKVDDQVVTNFELTQRIAFLELLNTPGDLEELALEQLIDDRLREQAARSVNLQLLDGALENAVEEFAARGNLKTEQFLELTAAEGIEKETVFAFVRSNLIWRELVRARFGRRVSVTETDIDRAMEALGSRASVRVLLSEVIIPLQPGYEAQITEIAEQVATIDSFGDFTEAAKRFSAAPTKETGGKLGWLPISQLPPALRPVLLGLEPGETTSVIPMQGALAVFQMRSIAESAYRAPDIAAVEYASLTIPGGRTPETLATAAGVAAAVDTCDDLYGENFGKSADLLTVTSAAPKDLPRGIAVELAKLDSGEVSYNLSTASGDIQLLMLCGRSPVLAQDASREDVTRQLRNEQLEGFANGYLEELRANARIIKR